MKISLSWISFLLAIFPSLLIVNSSQALVFKKIADTSTPIPGGTGNFLYFDTGVYSAPLINNNNVFLVGNGSNFQAGVYGDFGNGLQTIVDTNSFIPGTLEKFTNFTLRAASDTNVAFEGYARRNSYFFVLQGIYADFGRGVETLVDYNTQVPGQNTTFSFLGGLSINNTNVLFQGEYSNGQGVYANFGNGWEIIADTSTVVPGNSQETFTSFFSPQLINNTNVLFGATYQNYQQTGIYGNFGNGLEEIINLNTSLPSGVRLGDVTFNETHVAAVGFKGTYEFKNGNTLYNLGITSGIYANFDNDNELEVVVDFEQLTPEDSIPYRLVRGLALSGENIVFSLNTSLEYPDFGGIYLRDENSNLRKIIASGDLLDEKTVSFIVFDGRGFDGDTIAFKTYFNDGTLGIFVANDIFNAPIISKLPPAILPEVIPEPLTLLGTGVAIGFGVAFKRKHKQQLRKP